MEVALSPITREQNIQRPKYPNPPDRARLSQSASSVLFPNPVRENARTTAIFLPAEDVATLHDHGFGVVERFVVRYSLQF